MPCRTCLHSSPIEGTDTLRCCGTPPQVVEIVKTNADPKGVNYQDIGAKRFATVWPTVSPDDRCPSYVHKA